MLFTWSLYLCRRRPTLPHTFARSTIGPAGLNLRRFAGVSEAGARSRNPERFVRGISNRAIGPAGRNPPGWGGNRVYTPCDKTFHLSRQSGPRAEQQKGIFVDKFIRE